jgi:hypothetical protein
LPLQKKFYDDERGDVAVKPGSRKPGLSGEDGAPEKPKG